MVGPVGLERGHLWLLDVGIAKHTGAPSTDTLLEVETVRYLSPEHAKHQKPDGRADIYAFGVIFCEILTGRRTFLDDTENTIVPDCPDEVWPLLGRCLEKDPAARIQSFQEILDELRDLMGET
jgi:serine/threonine-protein kinase